MVGMKLIKDFILLCISIVLLGIVGVVGFAALTLAPYFPILLVVALPCVVVILFVVYASTTEGQ